MRTLRVLLAAPPHPARAEAWAVFDERGRVLERGRSPPSAWPGAESREAVLAAEAVRVISLALPPLPASRLAQAATFALEDRLATPPDESVVAFGERRVDGRVIAIAAARELVESLSSLTPPFVRGIAEPELAEAVDGWRWCEEDGKGFVRTDDGAAFTVTAGLSGSIPPELGVALAQAARAGRAPAVIVADREGDAVSIAAWERAGGVPFRAGTPWRWTSAPARAFASATDLVAPSRRADTLPLPSPASTFRTAASVAMLAIALHLVATAGTWTWRRLELAQANRALVALAHEAGARDATSANAIVELARHHAQARHRAGLAAPNDALPLLARAAPALSALPAGALKNATFSGGAWTLELAALDDAALAALAHRLAQADIAALHARTSGGVRARLGPAR